MASIPRRRSAAGLGPPPSQRFCVYEHIRSDDETCFWVGKGTLKRAFSIWPNRDHSKFYVRIVKKLLAGGFEVRVRIVKEGLTEPEAFALERVQIAKYGRRNNGTGILANLTDGGEGPSGMKHSVDTRARMAEKLRINQANGGYTKGRSLSVEHRNKISKTFAEQSPEQRRARSEAISKGLVASQANGGYTKGHKLSVEHRAKLSAAKIGNKNGAGHIFTAEHKAKLSAKARRPKQPAHRAKLQALCRARNKTKAMRKLVAERNKRLANERRQELQHG